MNDPIDKILARVKAFVHFRDLHPDESYTSPEARDAIALAAEVEALRKDAEARSLYDRTAAAQGFTNAPHWNDLAEETRQMYRDERAKRDAAMGESHAE